MSTTISNSDFTVVKSRENWQPRPAILEAMGHLADVFKEAYSTTETGDTWLAFDNAIGRTTIFATPIDITTQDGYHVLDRIVVKTVLPEGNGHLDEAMIAQVNTLATTGALMIDPITGELVIVSSVTLLEGDGEDDNLLRLYISLIAYAAVFHPACLASIYGPAQADSETYALDEPEGFNEPGYWGLEDFKPAENMLRQAGIFSNAGATGLTAEFPWEDGGVSWVTGDETSLLTFQSDLRHPNVGNGLFFKLELPEAYSEDELRALVSHLNMLEVTGADVPPFLGAWCSHPKTRRIAYVGFLPNIAYWPGSVANISGWLSIRARNARAAIGNFAFHGEASQHESASIVNAVN